MVKLNLGSKIMELTPELYIELTLKVLPILVSKLNEKMEEAKQELENATTPDEQMQIIFGIILSLTQEVGEGVLPEGITYEDIENYKKEHEAEIDEYFQEQPEIQAEIEGLQKQFESIFPS